MVLKSCTAARFRQVLGTWICCRQCAHVRHQLWNRRAPVEACVCHMRTGLPQPPHGSEPPSAPRLCSSIGVRPDGGGCCPRAGAGSCVAGLVAVLGNTGTTGRGALRTGAAASGLYGVSPGAAGALGRGWADTGAALLFLPPPLEVLSRCCQRSASICRCNSRASASSLETSEFGWAGSAAEESCCSDPLSDFRVQCTLRPAPQVAKYDDSSRQRPI